MQFIFVLRGPHKRKCPLQIKNKKKLSPDSSHLVKSHAGAGVDHTRDVTIGTSY